MRCERVNIKRRGMVADAMVQCPDDATEQIEDSTGKTMGRYCSTHSARVLLHPGWTRSKL